MGLIAEIKVCKTIRHKIYIVFYKMKCSKCREVWIWTSTITYVISKLILYFPYNFHVPCILLFTVYFHVPCTVRFTVYCNNVIPIFLFLCYWFHSKANAVNQTIQLCFYQRLTIGQSFKRTSCNGWKWIAVNTVNFKIVTFFFEIYFERGAPNMYTN